jgi:K(+)-stimulated pyrophosphate-energized sodium pump
MVSTILLAVPLLGVLALIFMFIKSSGVSKQDPGNELMQRIGKNIADGAMAFLKAEYKVLSIFVIAVAIILGVSAAMDSNEDTHWMISVSFIVGAICSGLAGFIGMNVATKANIRTTQAARTSLGKALGVAFDGGAVMGLGVVGLGLLGLGSLFFVFQGQFGMDTEANVLKVISVLTGFSFGASSIALFARVGGGIYTKAADVGADLAGKVVEDIPEDDPRNPATIADNVGDNVGDVAGMGSDLFGSFAEGTCAALVVASHSQDIVAYGWGAIYFPLTISAAGIFACLVTSFIATNVQPVRCEADVEKVLKVQMAVSTLVR